MATSIEYRVNNGGASEHLRPSKEGVLVRMSAMMSEPGRGARDIDMSGSSDASTFISNYESFKTANALSSVSNVDNVYFREIVKMGRRAVPFIYEEMKKGPTDLVYALDEIFGHPIKYNGFMPLKQSCELWISILKKTEKD